MPSGASIELQQDAEVFRIDPAARAKGRWRQRASTAFGVLVLLVIGWIDHLDRLGRHGSIGRAPDVWLVCGVLALLVLVSGLWKGASDDRALAAYSLVLCPDSVRCTPVPGRSVELRREGVARILESSQGLVIVARDGASHVRVPPTVERYAEARARLARWSDIEVLGPMAMVRSALWAAFPTLGWAVPSTLGLNSRNMVVVVGAMVALFANQAWLLRDDVLAPGLPRWKQRSLIACFVAWHLLLLLLCGWHAVLLQTASDLRRP